MNYNKIKNNDFYIYLEFSSEFRDQKPEPLPELYKEKKM